MRKGREIAKRVCEALRDLESAHIFGTEIMERIGISRNTLINYQRGTASDVKGTAIAGLVEVYGYSPQWLLLGHEPKKTSQVKEMRDRGSAEIGRLKMELAIREAENQFLRQIQPTDSADSIREKIDFANGMISRLKSYKESALSGQEGGGDA